MKIIVVLMETDDMVHLGFGSCRGALAPSTARAAAAPPRRQACALVSRERDIDAGQALFPSLDIMVGIA
ncbi:hypothetical protein [Sorangium sp. So ce145]|uniref:hypothetical protein n=1 Tax=Sorangium sp. So ce145 TaxID=3133285 RepID=UPI003F61F6BA